MENDGQGQSHAPRGGVLPLALAAMGVVYGDIGTSPLYAVKECFHGLHAIPVNQQNVLGVLSLIFWSLMVVVSIKYVLFVMRANNRGEGGTFALLAVIHAKSTKGISRRTKSFLTVIGVFGASLLFGESIITPPISVLSAIEGLNVATEAAKPLVIPLTCVIIFFIFAVQRYGTAKIGVVFGPVMLVWFVTLAVLGLVQIAQRPEILAAVNPANAVMFFVENKFHGLIVLGSVVLCITGGEALYADMGHFGARPIRLSWVVMVGPALMLNYFGQGAMLLADPSKTSNPFYALVPGMLLYPMVVLATMATIIASQAMISGVFSLAQQAMQLGFAPRLHIVHTSGEARGQIYLPGANRVMMLACIALVLIFKESSNLAAAYGIAVTATMTITSVLFYNVIRANFGWPRKVALPLLVLFLSFDITYFGSNLLKVMDGGWLPLTLATILLAFMLTWRDGRRALADQFSILTLPLDLFISDVETLKPHRVAGSAVFMASNIEGTPIPLLHHFKHNKVLHERVILLSIIAGDAPKVERSERLDIAELKEGFFRVTAKYGFMETPDIEKVVVLMAENGLKLDMNDTTFFLGRETLLTNGKSPMMRWRKKLFAFMSKNAWNATTYFNIPPGRVVELGSQVVL